MKKSYISPFIVAFVISGLVFFGLWYGLKQIELMAIKEQSAQKMTQTSVKNNSKKDKLDSELLYIQSCLQQQNKPNEFEGDCPKILPQPASQGTEKNIVSSSDDDKIKKAWESNILIHFIEFLLIFSLAIQMYLVYFINFLRESNKFDKYIYYLSDWTINIPPILGVLANLVSFAIVIGISGENQGNIMAYFPKYFFEAVITTLIGGIFYIINLFLNIFIHPNLEENKNNL